MTIQEALTNSIAQLDGKELALAESKLQTPTLALALSKNRKREESTTP